jgi:hypothetical protein
VACPFLAEGLAAHAAEQADIEQRRSLRWLHRWAAIRERAVLVQSTRLGEQDVPISLPEIIVELNEEEPDALEDNDDDQEEDEMDVT